MHRTTFLTTVCGTMFPPTCRTRNWVHHDVRDTIAPRFLPCQRHGETATTPPRRRRHDDTPMRARIAEPTLRFHLRTLILHFQSTNDEPPSPDHQPPGNAAWLPGWAPRVPTTMKVQGLGLGETFLGSDWHSRAPPPEICSAESLSSDWRRQPPENI